MKKLYLLLITLFLASGVMSQNAQPCSTCLPEGIWFSTQAQIDSFAINYPECTGIEGSVHIGPTIWYDSTNITNLNGLSQITSIGDTLWINSNSSLINLEGLNNVGEIGGSFYLFRNDVLTDLTGLDNLHSIGADFRLAIMTNGPNFQGNSALTSLNGLGSLETIGGSLCIFANDALTSLNGIENLQCVGESLEIGIFVDIPFMGFCRGNYSLVDLTALENLNSVGAELFISGNTLLTSLSGLENIQTDSMAGLTICCNTQLTECAIQNICDYLDTGDANIFDNAAGCNSEAEVYDVCHSCMAGGIIFTTQEQIDSFPINHPECTEIDGDIYIGALTWTDTSNITNVTGLSQLTSIGNNLTIIQNGYLTNLTGLNNLNSVGGNLQISSCPALTNIVGLENLTNVGKGVEISYCDSLSAISGLENLTTIGSDFNIWGNNSLVNLSGLEKIWFIGGNFSIGWNEILTGLAEMDDIYTVVGNVEVFFNDSLTNLTGFEHLIAIGGGVIISDNISLTDISGISNLEYIGGDLTINANYNLSQCNVQSVCNYIAAPEGAIIIFNNATGCNSQEEVETACGVGVDESAVGSRQSLVKIYPNPTSGLIYIEINRNKTEFQISIFNFQGQQVLQQQASGPQTTVDVSGLSKGIYLVRVQDEKGGWIEKLVKQ